MTEKKLWSQQTVEERVRSLIRAQERFVEEIDPGDQFLTHDNFINDRVNYYIVDLNRDFLRRLQSIVDNPWTPKEGE
jgi:hypothetical protein